MINRNDIGQFLNRYDLTGNGIEIGVQKGEFSKQILSQWQGKMLYLVDCWEQQENYNDLANCSDNEQSANYKTTLKNIAWHTLETYQNLVGPAWCPGVGYPRPLP